MASQWTLIWLLVLSLTIAVFAIDVHNMNIDEYLSYVNPPAVHKFQNEHGDSILCVLYADQISLRGSEQPSIETRNEQKTKVAQNFSVKTGCPEDTVPILETKREAVERKGSVTGFINSHRKIMTQSAKNLNAENLSSNPAVSQVAQVIVDENAPFYSVSAQLNVWKPKVDINGSGVSSATQIWAGSSDFSSLVETVLVGWEVDPSLYGDTNPRFFVSWSINDRGKPLHGCRNTLCPGFVLASGVTNYLGAVISPVSTYNGIQHMITVKLLNVQPDGSDHPIWSVYLNYDLMGWWPASLFSYIYSNAERVGLGGEVLFHLGEPSSKTEMGNGHFPDEGWGRSAHVRNTIISNDNGVMTDFYTYLVAPRPKCYNVSDVTAYGNGNIFFFGGPGGDDADCAATTF